MDCGNVEFFCEQVSGKSFDRPEIQKCTELIKSNQVSVFIVYKLDRLGRNIIELNQFIDLCNKHDVEMVGVIESFNTKSAVGRMVINIMASFAQYERELISERTSAALQQKKSNGKKYCKNPPFGKMFDADGNMVDCNQELEDFEDMKFLRSKNKTYGEICERLESEGIVSRSGKPYARSFIGKLLKGE
jgi:site-specific DNA recombinase